MWLSLPDTLATLDTSFLCCPQVRGPVLTHSQRSPCRA